MSSGKSPFRIYIYFYFRLSRLLLALARSNMALLFLLAHLLLALTVPGHAAHADGMALRDDPSSYSTLSTVMPSSVSADIAVPRKSQRPKVGHMFSRSTNLPLTWILQKRDASSALLPRQTNVPVADAATSTEPIQQAGGRETYGGTCLFLCIAMAVSATLVVLIAASVALLCGRPWFKCKRCVTDNLSAAEEQKWPISSMKTYEGCPPWLLSIPEQPQQQAEQQQCLASQQEQSWSPVTTLANGQNDVVSPMDFQTWNGSQHT